MEYFPHQSVYENVMRNVGKIVKARLSETYKSEKISFLMELSKEYLDHQKLGSWYWCVWNYKIDMH